MGITPKEKARELIEKMSYNNFDEDHNCSHYVAKNCALIAVNEVRSNCEWNTRFYWQEVEQEIENF